MVIHIAFWSLVVIDTIMLASLLYLYGKALEIHTISSRKIGKHEGVAFFYLIIIYFSYHLCYPVINLVNGRNNPNNREVVDNDYTTYNS